MEISEKIRLISGSDFDILSEKEKQLVNRLLNEYYVRLQRMVKNNLALEFKLRCYDKEGKQKKYSVHIRADCARVFEADYADWDLARALHKTLNKLLNEIEHEYHSSDQRDKQRRVQKNRERGR